MDKICQIISRYRSLDNDTLPLFLQPDLTELRLYDCSRISSLSRANVGLTSEKMEQIAYLTPNLKTLQLSFCGRLVDNTLETIISRLPNLEHLILIGAFLVKTEQWQKTLRSLGSRLRTFEVTDTARWNEECTEALVTYCPNLEVLGMKRINILSDATVSQLSKLKKLKKLDLTAPGGIVTDNAVVPILQSTGSTLETLVLDACVELGEPTFQAIVNTCPNLQHLSIACLDQITDECVAKGFQSWKQNSGLETLNLTRCVGIKDSGVQAVLHHSGASLEILSLNSLDELTQETFKLFIDEENNIGHELVDLDVGFVRCINDDVVYALSRACKELRIIKVCFSMTMN